MNTHIGRLNEPQEPAPAHSSLQREQEEREQKKREENLKNGIVVDETEMADIARKMGMELPTK